MKNVFIIGSKGIPAKYGGFETFVDNLVSRKKSNDIKYYVTCLTESDNVEREFEYNGATCFNIRIKDIGSAKAITYDIKSILECEKYINKNSLKNCCIYILACRIGPFLYYYKKRLEKQGIKVFVNPDGHEWKRSKWNKAIKTYWKFSEKLMVKEADLLICDSIEIERYIKTEYEKYNPKTKYISYGAEIENNNIEIDTEKLLEWYEKHNITENQYFLIVGRFVPENNYELMIREFMNSKTTKDLVIITNVEKNKFYDELLANTYFNNDSRIKFVGTVYDKKLIYAIRTKAFGYLHGHEVGGTNPSLLEALATTNMNLLLDVAFNKEVGREAAVYFDKKKGSLSSIIDEVDNYEQEDIDLMGIKGKKVIEEFYSWDKIICEYENLFNIY
ncbi:beta 1-4 rhamnosyltransferase Cps2T [Clostridium omnivorum]|uniref:Glycosyl transferase n=1 Tax=Clostridium omnivorum TaxID=1604902 RepID=A0ABQ5N3G1_9CLOT|nr:DUF1972 domain-containing protein [Clostridium sp. E14]GLC29731.1 glycosyl transferase [Clostridium sp. E14]